MKQLITVLVSILIGLTIGYIVSPKEQPIVSNEELTQAQKEYMDACEELLDSIALEDFGKFMILMETETYYNYRHTKDNVDMIYETIEDQL